MTPPASVPGGPFSHSSGSSASAYDPAWRLAGVTDGLHDLSAAYGYLTNSALVGHPDYTNGSTHVMTTSKSYDGLNRLTGIQTQEDQASTLAAFAYGYNAVNQSSDTDHHKHSIK